MARHPVAPRGPLLPFIAQGRPRMAPEVNGPGPGLPPSSAVGIGLSYSGWQCRSLLSPEAAAHLDNRTEVVGRALWFSCSVAQPGSGNIEQLARLQVL